MTYFLQFVVGLSIAGKLGPYYFGIYSFLLLILNYFGNLNLGINHSLNVFLVHSKNKEKESDDYIGNSLFIALCQILFVSFIYLLLLTINIEDFQRYDTKRYLIWIVLIASLGYFNTIFTTILRIKNKINAISIIQSLEILIDGFCVVFFIEETLIIGLLIGKIVSALSCCTIAIINKVLPKHKPNINIKIQYKLLEKGFLLFIYNSCLAFITITNRTIIGNNYNVEDFGKFNFAYQLGNALISLGAALTFLIFPKVLDAFSTCNNREIDKILCEIEDSYISANHLLIYLSLPFFILLTMLMPKYSDGLTAMNLISLVILITNHSFGYSSLLIAKNQEKKCAIISFISFVINFVFAYMFVCYFKFPYDYAILSTLLAYFFFCTVMACIGHKMIEDNGNVLYAFRRSFPLKLMVPFSCAIIISSFKMEYLIWIPLLIYILFNYKDLKKIFLNYIIKLIKAPNFIEIH